MDYFENVLEAVGNTPLIRMGRIERDEGIEATLLAKVEYLNPAGSVKDRPAVKMLEIAEKEGLLGPGGTVVEPTSGNTGAGLAMAAAVKGYRCICVMPDKVSKEKQDLLKAMGAEVIVTPTAPPDDPRATTPSPRGWQRRSLAASSQANTRTRPILFPTTRRRDPRSGARPKAASHISSLGWAPAEPSRERAAT